MTEHAVPAVPRFVSSGALPGSAEVRAALADVIEEARQATGGEVSQTYPALAQVDPGLFGLSIAAVTGQCHHAGDSAVEFTTMSVVKPFTFALVAERHGIEETVALTGANATGLPFNSLAAVERGPGGRTNAMVNAGAIAAASLMPGTSVEDRWSVLLAGLGDFAGRELHLNDEVYASSRAGNERNRATALLLAARSALAGDPLEAAELYTRQSSVSVTTADLAVMGATLADGGVHPTTGRRVVGPEVARAALAMMTVAGMYETSGEWLLEVGMPGKSGISGAMVTVSPGKGAVAAYSPPIDEAGNSVRGQAATRLLARRLGMDVLASAARDRTGA